MAADTDATTEGSPTADTPARPERLHALDAVRGFALLLVVAGHAALPFMPGPQIWLMQFEETTVIAPVLFFAFNAFVMATFFLIAGYFGRQTIERVGTKRFAGDRLKRVALPFVVCWLLLFPLVFLVIRWAALRAGPEGLPPITAPGSGGYLMHLWFLWVLLIFYAVALVLRLIAIRFGPGAMTRVDAAVKWLNALPVPLLLAIPPFIAFALTPGWLGWFGVPTPGGIELPHPIAMTVYGMAFGLGWLVHRQPELMQVWARRWLLNLGCAFGLVVACLWLNGPLPSLTPPPDETIRLAYDACFALLIWFGIFMLIGVAMRFLGGYHPVVRYVSDASFWIYLLHLPIVMALQVLLTDVALPWPIKYPMILGPTLIVLVGSYHLIFRLRILAGLFKGRRGRERAGETARVA